MEEDPFASIVKECQITSSQEEVHRRYHFACNPGEEVTSLAPPCPVQSTGIMMVTPPDSDVDHQEEEVFHTPPEHHRSQSMSSSEDQGPEIRPGHPQVVGQKDIGGRAEEVPVVDCFKDAEMTVDLGKDSDILGFSESKFSEEIDGDDSVKDVVPDVDVSKEGKYEPDLNKYDVLGSDRSQTVFAENELSAENLQSTSQNVYLGDTEPISTETENIEIGETEVVDLSSEEICKETGARVTENTENVSNVHTDKDGSNKGVSGRRELPNSFQEPSDNEGLWVPRRSVKDKTFKDLLDAAKIVLDDVTDTDYLKIAKECGLTFYRPRWWPPEGFDDQVTD